MPVTAIKTIKKTTGSVLTEYQQLYVEENASLISAPFYCKDLKKFNRGYREFNSPGLTFYTLDWAKKVIDELDYFLWMREVRNRDKRFEQIWEVMEKKSSRLEQADTVSLREYLQKKIYWRRPTDQQSGNRERAQRTRLKIAEACLSYIEECKKAPSVRKLMALAKCGTHQALEFIREVLLSSLPDFHFCQSVIKDLREKISKAKENRKDMPVTVSKLSHIADDDLFNYVMSIDPETTCLSSNERLEIIKAEKQRRKECRPPVFGERTNEAPATRFCKYCNQSIFFLPDAKGNYKYAVEPKAGIVRNEIYSKDRHTHHFRVCPVWNGFRKVS